MFVSVHEHDDFKRQNGIITVGAIENIRKTLEFVAKSKCVIGILFTV